MLFQSFSYTEYFHHQELSYMHEVYLSNYATKAYADNAVSTAIGEIGTILDSVNGEVI